MIVEDDDDDIVLGQPVAQLVQPSKSGSRRISHEQALFASEPTSCEGRIFVGDFFKVVDDVKIDIARYDIFTDALGQIGVDFLRIVLTRLVIFFKHRTIGINAPDDDVGVLLFEVAPRS